MHFAGLDRLGLLGITSFGDTSSKASAITAASQHVAITNSANAPTVGSCTPDGQFIYDRASDGSIFTRRLKVGEVCTSTSGTNPTIVVHNEDTSLTITSPDGTVTQIPPTVGLAVSSRTMDAEALKRNTDEFQVEALNLKALVALGVLDPCPPESYHDGAYSTPEIPYYSCFYYTSTSLMPPLTFEVQGVAFHVGEIVKDAGFKRDFQPNTDQQFWIANGLRKMALRQSDFATDAQGSLADAWADAIQKVVTFGLTGSNGVVYIGLDGLKRLQNPSVGDFLAVVPDARTSFPGLTWNPPQPTSSQMNDPGGLAKWSQAGGFFMSYQMASGQLRWGDAYALGVNTLPLCACQTNIVETADRISLKMDTTLNGITAQAQFGWLEKDGTLVTAGSGDDLGVAWGTYIDIVTNPGVWHIEVRHEDPSWISRVAQTLGNILQAIAKIFCGDPQFQQGINTLANTKCIDGNNKPCTKGKAGCTCTTAPASVQAGAALTGWYVQNWCSDFQQEIKNTTNPTFQQPVIPPGQITTTIVPTWVIALGIVVGAGVLFGLKKKHDIDGKPVSLLPALTP